MGTRISPKTKCGEYLVRGLFDTIPQRGFPGKEIARAFDGLELRRSSFLTAPSLTLRFLKIDILVLDVALRVASIDARSIPVSMRFTLPGEPMTRLPAGIAVRSVISAPAATICPRQSSHRSE